ncbi:MAG: hypothetical protein QOH47_1608 [Sphingomonadales bacterium]|jgi:hypothetical protein|nr:hypothetical protein [Sphingomonadales bacterium]
MRRLAFLVPLASCGSPPAVAPDHWIDCRPQGEAAFARACTVEAFDSDDGRLLTIRKPDGGFRRLRVTTDGSGVVAADGAERTRVAILPGNLIEVEIGGDRFRLPAQVRAR